MSRTKKRKTHAVPLPVMLLAGILLVACQPAQPAATPKPTEKPAAAATPAAAPTKAAEQPIKGGTLRAVVTADPATLDAHLGVGNEGRVNQSIYDHLIEFDKDENVTKDGLFRDWTVSSDGKTITFKVREGVRFHDGTALDAAAVKFNLERIRDAATKSPFRADYAGVDTVDVVDSFTVRFNLRQADAVLLSKMGLQGSSMLVSPAAVQKYGQDFGRNPVGSGPFQFVEWVPGDHVTLKRFEGYWRQGLPYVDQLVIKIITDPSVALANLRTGQADIFAAIPADQLAILKTDPNLIYVQGRGMGTGGIFMNTKKAPFDNKALRQAVALAPLDRDGIATVTGGSANASIFHPVDFGYDPQIGVFPSRDLAKAKAKMAEAGSAAGVKVKLSGISSPQVVRTSEILKANLAEIGIDAEIEALAAPAFVAKISANNYQMANYGVTWLADPGYGLGTYYHSKGSRNYFGPYSNPQLDQLIDKGGSTYDQKERKAAYQDAAKILVDEAPSVATYITSQSTGVSKKVRDFAIYADGMERYMRVWLVP